MTIERTSSPPPPPSKGNWRAHHGVPADNALIARTTGAFCACAANSQGDRPIWMLLGRPPVREPAWLRAGQGAGSRCLEPGDAPRRVRDRPRARAPAASASSTSRATTRCERDVAIKEYMPASLAGARRRRRRVSLRSERSPRPSQAASNRSSTKRGCWRSFDHPSLVKVYRFWEANGTAYMVMPFYEGMTLKDARLRMRARARRGLAARRSGAAPRRARAAARRERLPPRHRARQHPAARRRPAAAARLRRRAPRHRRHDAGADRDPQAAATRRSSSTPRGRR